jgi:hypothetical protein
MSEDAIQIYYEFVDKIKSKFGSFCLDAEAGIDNKSAALRARKLSMILRTDLKDFRTISVNNDRANATQHEVNGLDLPCNHDE